MGELGHSDAQTLGGASILMPPMPLNGFQFSHKKIRYDLFIKKKQTNSFIKVQLTYNKVQSLKRTL